MKNNTLHNLDVTHFYKDIYTVIKDNDGRNNQKQLFKAKLIEYKNNVNPNIRAFSAFGVHMVDKGCRIVKNPRPKTMLQYISFIKPLSLLLGETDILDLGELELATVFEQIQELKGNNKSTNSALLNLYTYLHEYHGKSMGWVNLEIISVERVDVNIIWSREVDEILNSDALSDMDKLFIRIIYECGCRITEAYQLIGQDIDILGEQLHLRTNRLGKMKNRYSTRCFDLSDLSEELRRDLLLFEGSSESAFFDVNKRNNEQVDFNKFCMRINAVIKKVTERIVSLKHLRHSRARIKFKEKENSLSIRDFYQNSAHLGHSNLRTGQTNYIHSVVENNELIGMNNKVAASLMELNETALRALQARYNKKHKDNQISNMQLNALFAMERLLKKAKSDKKSKPLLCTK
jgi:integrase